MDTPTVAICVATFRRARSLQCLLKSLSAMDTQGMDVHLIIADNDPEESARQIVESEGARIPVPVTYVAEPVRGLSSVRNRLVAEAGTLNAGFIAFVDDDETVHPEWLKALLDEARRSNADAVMGRQIRWMDNDIPEYIQHCFPIPNIKTGTRIKRFSTANVLIRMKSLDQIDGPFDTRLNFTGGEDSMLAARMTKLGHVIVWCNEAETSEYIPRTRTKPRYILQRAFRSGTTRSKIVRWSDSSPKKYVLHIFHSLGIIA